jgi:hypothetical protein
MFRNFPTHQRISNQIDRLKNMLRWDTVLGAVFGAVNPAGV